MQEHGTDENIAILVCIQVLRCRTGGLRDVHKIRQETTGVAEGWQDGADQVSDDGGGFGGYQQWLRGNESWKGQRREASVSDCA